MHPKRLHWDSSNLNIWDFQSQEVGSYMIKNLTYKEQRNSYWTKWACHREELNVQQKMTYIDKLYMWKQKYKYVFVFFYFYFTVILGYKKKRKLNFMLTICHIFVISRTFISTHFNNYKYDKKPDFSISSSIEMDRIYCWHFHYM